MQHSLAVSTVLSIIMASICMIISLIFSRDLISVFIRHASSSLIYGSVFLRILCIGCPFSALAYMLISFFQAVEKGRQSLILALLRKGILDIPLIFVLDHLFPPFGLAWATPAADIVCSIVSVFFFAGFVHHHKYSDNLVEADE